MAAVETPDRGPGQALGQDQGDALAALGADRAEQVGGAEALLPHPARTHPFLVPDAGRAALLPNPGLVHEPQLDAPGLGVPAASRITPGRAFEPLLRLQVGLGVPRSGLLPREVEALEQPEHPALAVAHAEAALDQGAQVAGPPGDTAVALQLRAPEDQRLEGRLLTLIECTRAAGAGPVPQALDALGIVAVDPVAEGLPGHAGEPCRFLPRQAVKRVGEREQASADAPVALAASEAAQLCRVAVGADRQGCGHGGFSRKNAAETPQASD
jgi:hypothetical protein